MIRKHIYTTREAWLDGRGTTIGGSDAGCILGLSPWKSNIDLYYEKIGQSKSADLSDNPLVQYGIKAEPLIRELFKLDYPDLNVWYEENNLFINGKYPWAHFSADGLLVDTNNGAAGILEIKTATISSGIAAKKWQDNHLPDGYLAQVLHAMMVMEADFAYLRALLKYPRDGEPDRISIKDYTIERDEVKDDIEYLIEKERAFAECIEKRIEPARILPSL
jgi:putative phage-type endonuclease